MRWTCSLVALAIGLAGCETFIDLDADQTPRQLELEGICDTATGVSLSVNRVYPLLGGSPLLRNAVATLTHPDGTTATLARDTFGLFTEPGPLLAGLRYRLDASADSLPPAWAECAMPEPVAAWSARVTGPADTDGHLPVRVQFQDPPGAGGYVLAFRALGETDSTGLTFTTSQPSIRETSFWASVQGVGGEPTFGLAPFSDRLFDGETFTADVRLDTTTGRPGSGSQRYVAELWVVGRDGFALWRYRLDRSLPSTPFGEPAVHPQNVQGGYGFVEARTTLRAPLSP